MRKRIALFVLLITVLSLAVSCHGAKGLDEFVIPETFDESKTYEITFWAKNDTNKAQVNIYKQAIEDFQKLYPNIKVNMRLYTDYGKIYNDVITNIATKTTPNVCITYPDHIATYLTGVNVVVPLDGLFSDPKYGFGGSELKYDGPLYSEMIEKFMDECVIGDRHYAIPYLRSTEACYVNKTFVEKLGYELPETLTWDFVFEVSEAAMKKDSEGNFIINGQKTMIPFIYKSTDNMMIQMLDQKHAGYSTADGEILLFNDTTKELLYMISDHVKSGAFSTFKISSYPANFLNAGQCIFAIDSTAGSTWMGSKAPLLDISEDALVEFETAVRTVPQFDPSDPSMISQGPSICIFNKEDPNEVLASWIFAQYMLTNEVQIAYSETEGYVPVTTKARTSEEYLDYLSRKGEDNSKYYDVKISAVEMFLKNTDNTFTTPVFNGSASLRDAAGQLIENVTKSVRRKQTVDEAFMTKLFSDVRSLYRLADNRGTGSNGNKDLGPLPGTAVFLITALILAWAGIGTVWIRDRILEKKRKQE